MPSVVPHPHPSHSKRPKTKHPSNPANPSASSSSTHPSPSATHPKPPTQPNPKASTNPTNPLASESTTASSSEPTPLAKKTAPITAIAKKKLRDYFIAENWPLNTLLPRGADKNLDSRLRAIKTEFNLNKSQISRQLKNS
mmetsp:Transcript_13611/g.29610  ORF Transcript_13611/g.29610 Transcript_13611/m.29610 type:complete len:140 (+) Transcript_13611:72-491(+)